jgi:sulfoxide reductase heme-binding subunit YedZ
MRSSPFAGFRLTASLAAGIGLGALTLILLQRHDPAPFGMAIRATARSSLLLFCLAYGAGALHQLFPSRFTRWALHNRRYLGLSFAASHAIHGLAILAFAQLQPERFAEHVRARSPLPGLIAYALILALALSSSDRAQAWLGMRAWKLLHGLGSLYVWAAFLKAFWIRVPGKPLYLLPVALLVGLMALRLASYVQRMKAAAHALPRPRRRER